MENSPFISVKGKRVISKQSPCFIIAEAGVNHNGSLDNAKKLIEVAKEAGANAVKFQTFKAENIATKSTPKSSYHIETTGSDASQSWYELLKSQELDLTAHIELAKFCKDVGIMFLSTPYDNESVDLLDELDVDMFKVASTDTNNHEFLKYIAKKSRPVILSTAMSEISEIKKSVETLKSAGCSDLVVLQCTGNYPCSDENLNIMAMLDIEKSCNTLVGFSDHSKGVLAGTVAVSLGAVVYEKHFTLSRGMQGPDHRASLEPDELTEAIKLIRTAEIMIGSGKKSVLESELENRNKLRKYAVARTNLKAGTVLNKDNVSFKRTGGMGIPPDLFSDLLGFKTKRDIAVDQPIVKSDIEKKE